MFFPLPVIVTGALLGAIRVRQKAKAPEMDADRRLFAAGPSAFWLDPRRWDGIEDTHSEPFWMKRRPDVIDIHSGYDGDDDTGGCTGY
jgi:hypothetical protein